MKYCSRVFDLIATRFPRKPVAYLLLIVLWLVTLWCLSAGNPVPKNAPQIPHLDKVAHFSYFAIGGMFLTVGGLVLWPSLKLHRCRVFCAVVIVGALVGRLDEYHQTFTPGRSGNDMGDWAADILGCAAGALFILAIVLPAVMRRDLKLKEAKNDEESGICR